CATDLRLATCDLYAVPFAMRSNRRRRPAVCPGAGPLPASSPRPRSRVRRMVPDRGAVAAPADARAHLAGADRVFVHRAAGAPRVPQTDGAADPRAQLRLRLSIHLTSVVADLREPARLRRNREPR